MSRRSSAEVGVVEQAAGEDFIVANADWVDQFGGLLPATREDIIAALDAAEISTLGDVVGTPRISVRAERRATDAVSTEAALAELNQIFASADFLDQMMINIAGSDVSANGSQVIDVHDEAWQVPTKTFPIPEGLVDPPADEPKKDENVARNPTPTPVVTAATENATPAPTHADEAQVEALFASFLRETASPVQAAPALAPVVAAKPEAAAARFRRSSTGHHFIVDEGDVIDDTDIVDASPADLPPQADPRLVALHLLEEAEIYRRFGQSGEAQQCVIRARQICASDRDIERRAQLLMLAISGSGSR